MRIVRRWSAYLCALAMAYPCVAQLAFGETAGADTPIQVSVDPRVELLSIVFRLAGNREYNTGRIKSYVHDVEEHFGTHRDHPAVQLAAKLRKTRGVSFDAPMSLAVHLAGAYTLKTKVPLSPRPPGLDGRWPEGGTEEFLQKTRQFVEDTKFAEFFEAHGPLYEEAVRRMKKLVNEDFHLEWFDKFFGARPGTEFHLVLGMLNGGSCYGTRLAVGDTEEIYCILGVWLCDRSGMPRFNRQVLPTVVHEFCHSYANPLVDKHAEELAQAGKRIFPRVKAKMKRMAYGNWRTMMYESVVRACVIRYVMATDGPQLATLAVKKEQKQGFLWIKELSDLLGEYEADRETYPTLESFFPKIVEFFDRYSQASTEPEDVTLESFLRGIEEFLNPPTKRSAD